MTIHSGKRGPYRWLETAERSLDDLVDGCWSVLDGKYVVVTTFDSGPLVLDEGERAAGWRRTAAR